MNANAPILTLAPWRQQGIALLQILFGVVWAIMYALVFVGLYLAQSGLTWGLDRRLTPALGRWGWLASGVLHFAHLHTRARNAAVKSAPHGQPQNTGQAHQS